MVRQLAFWLLFSAKALSGQEHIEVAITAPEFAEAVFGPVRIAAEVYPAGENIEALDFYLDGFLVGRDNEAPFEVLVDVGQENKEHLFEVLVYMGGIEVASAELRSRQLSSDLAVDVELLQLFVTVTDRETRVLGLGRDSFEVLDDGVRQSLVTFSGGEVPFSALVLVDASTSMAGGRLQTAVQGALTFLDQMEPADEAKLILFSDRILEETTFSSLSGLVTLALDGARAGGGSAVNDAIYYGIKRLTPRLSRKVLILLSDGHDVDSALPMAQVRSVLQQQQVVVYWIRLNQDSKLRQRGQSWVTNWRGSDDNLEEIAELEQSVVESGGRIIPVDRISEVGPAFAETLKELREQYVLGYYPLAERGFGSWHDVKVEVRGGLQARVRGGYLEK